MGVHDLYIVGISRTAPNPHGGEVCLSKLDFLTNFNSCKNNWYEPPCPYCLSSQQISGVFLGILGNTDESATRAGFSRPEYTYLSTNNLDGGLT